MGPPTRYERARVPTKHHPESDHSDRAKGGSTPLRLPTGRCESRGPAAPGRQDSGALGAPTFLVSEPIAGPDVRKQRNKGAESKGQTSLLRDHERTADPGVATPPLRPQRPESSHPASARQVNARSPLQGERQPCCTARASVDRRRAEFESARAAAAPPLPTSESDSLGDWVTECCQAAVQLRVTCEWVDVVRGTPVRR